MTEPYESYTYDALGELASQTHPTGVDLGPPRKPGGNGTSITVAHDATPTALTTTTTDETGRPTTATTDLWGRTLEVSQPGATTTYGYDSANRLVSITDPNQLVATRSYNSLGQLVKDASPDRGTWTYTYDTVGNLHTTTDGRGHITTYGYDALNRLISKVDKPGSGGVAGAPFTTTWHYDQAGHGASIGQLTSVSGPSGTGCPSNANGDHNVISNLNYDKFGRLISTTTCVTGQSETIGVGYDSVGRPSTTTYPGGEQVTTGYDAAGRPDSLRPYVTSATYDPGGRLIDLQLGDGSDNRYTYYGDGTGRGWLTSITDQSSTGASLYQTTITHNPNGTIASESSAAGSASSTTLSYGYDALNRLTSVAGDTPATFTYDPAGNITGNSTLGTYHYNPTSCGQPTCPTSQQLATVTMPSGRTETFRYDANGNLTKQTRHASGTRKTTRITWDGYNQPTDLKTLANGTVVSDLKTVYDANGNLAQQTDTTAAGTSDLRYFGPLLQQSNQNLIKNYVFGGQVVARNGPGGVIYLHQDRLGSPVVVTDSSGAAASTSSYTPWGAATPENPPPGQPSFTGAQQLTGSSIVQMGARLYDPTLGRFLSADSLDPAGPGTQAANRYAYASDDPVNLVDPTGHEGCVPFEASLVDDGTVECLDHHVGGSGGDNPDEPSENPPNSCETDPLCNGNQPSTNPEGDCPALTSCQSPSPPSNGPVCYENACPSGDQPPPNTDAAPPNTPGESEPPAGDMCAASGPVCQPENAPSATDLASNFTLVPTGSEPPAGGMCAASGPVCQPENAPSATDLASTFTLGPPATPYLYTGLFASVGGASPLFFLGSGYTQFGIAAYFSRINWDFLGVYWSRTMTYPIGWGYSGTVGVMSGGGLGAIEGDSSNITIGGGWTARGVGSSVSLSFPFGGAASGSAQAGWSPFGTPWEVYGGVSFTTTWCAFWCR
jgi:RHS repeat-associated protein